jgi:Uma2 family endonuclease
MFEPQIIMGVNAPKDHQRIITKLITGLGNLYFNLGEIPYEPFPEVMIDEGQTSPTPDVILFDNENQRNVVIIEVSSSAGAKKDFEKVKALMKDYEVQEGFVYDYIQGTWRKYDLKKGEIKDNPSYCEAIGYDLQQFI